MVQAFPLVEVSGSPRERGLSHGRQAADRVKIGIALYQEQILGFGLGATALAGLVSDFLPIIETFDPSYVEEMRGIAAGAGVNFEEIVLLNARTEIVKLAGLSRQRIASAARQDGCTGLTVLPAATRAGHLIHAQNWDWKRECVDTAIVLRVRREEGPDILTFTEAGGLARSGFNSAGIAITANYLESDRDYAELGVPLAFIRRKVLEAEHLALAMHTVYVTRKSASNNMMVSHCDGVAIDFECAPDETFLLHPENGLIVHANHWESPVALGKLRDRSIVSMPDSLYRGQRVADLLKPGLGGLEVDHVKAVLFDDFGTPWSVCCPPRRNFGSSIGATVAMIVMVPQLGSMEVAPLPALNREFTTYRLTGEPAVRADIARTRSR